MKGSSNVSQPLPQSQPSDFLVCSLPPTSEIHPSTHPDLSRSACTRLCSVANQHSGSHFLVPSAFFRSSTRSNNMVSFVRAVSFLLQLSAVTAFAPPSFGVKQQVRLVGGWVVVVPSARISNDRLAVRLSFFWPSTQLTPAYAAWFLMFHRHAPPDRPQRHRRRRFRHFQGQFRQTARGRSRILPQHWYHGAH